MIISGASRYGGIPVLACINAGLFLVGILENIFKLFALCTAVCECCSAFFMQHFAVIVKYTTPDLLDGSLFH